MRSLYSFCRPYNKKDIDFYAFNEINLFGLQFYLEREIQRVSLWEGRAWADVSVMTLMKTIKDTDTQDKSVFVACQENKPDYEAILLDLGYSLRELRGDRFWFLFSVKTKK